MDSKPQAQLQTQPQPRPIRSYVLRQGRLTLGQSRAFAEYWPRLGVEAASQAGIDSQALFGNDRPLVLEIGFGNGEALFASACQTPEQNFLGIEVHGPGVGHLLMCAGEQGLDNLRLMRQDAVKALKEQIRPGALSGIRVFFPDPWHKTKHRKRRLVQAPFLALCAQALARGGLLHLATDWQPYAKQMLRLLEAAEDFANTQPEGGYSPRPEWRPLTRFEQRGQRLGHEVWDLIFQRI